jgi:hypothetical protein
MPNILCLALIALLTGVASGHGIPIDLSVVEGALRVSHGGPTMAPFVIVQPDEDGDPVGPFTHPVLGTTLLWGVPGVDITGMAPTASLALEFLAPPGLAGAPQSLWFWDTPSRAVATTPANAELRVLLASGSFTPVRGGSSSEPTPALLAATVAGQTGYHNHSLMNFAMPYDPTPAPGLYGFFARFTSNAYSPSEWFLATFNTGVGYDEIAPAAEALWGAAFPGDYDRNSLVNSADLATWGSSYGEQLFIARTLGDGNADGVVNAADYTVWRDAVSSPATSVPEPAAAVLVVAALALLKSTRGGAGGIAGRRGLW